RSERGLPVRCNVRFRAVFELPNRQLNIPILLRTGKSDWKVRPPTAASATSTLVFEVRIFWSLGFFLVRHSAFDDGGWGLSLGFLRRLGSLATTALLQPPEIRNSAAKRLSAARIPGAYRAPRPQ